MTSAASPSPGEAADKNLKKRIDKQRESVVLFPG